MQNAANLGAGAGLYTSGVLHLINHEYDDAVNAFMEGLELHPDNFEGLGLCFELGFGGKADRELALECYKDGAKKGSSKCRVQLERVKRFGFWPATETYRKKLIRGLEYSYGVGGASSGSGGIYGGGGIPNNPGGGSSSGSTYRTCPSCSGTGTCSSCHGSGGEWRDTGYYTGSSTKSWISCPSCRGSKRCFNCHGSGRI